MYKIIFGSNSEGKWKELVDDFKEEEIELILSEKYLNLAEDELTLASNSFAKANSASRQTHMLSIGDDSAICVEALDYFPGVHSRRWYSSPADDKGRNEKLLEMMDGEENRTVFLISRFTLTDEEGNKLFSTSVKNKFKLATEIRGTGGFGYDPVLIPSEEMVIDCWKKGKITFDRLNEIVNNHLTSGELSQEEKNAINNRGRIAKEIRRFLDSHYGK